MDLGAQYVYPESVGCIHDLEWPYTLIDWDYHDWHGFRTYDSSGLRMYDATKRDMDEFLQEQEIKILNDSNSEASVGKYIEKE